MQNISESNQVEYAGFWVRLFAYLIDMVIIGIPLLLVRLILWLVTWGLDGTVLTKNLLFQYNLTDIVLYLLCSTYFVSCTYLTGTTVGKKLLNLKVVREDEEEKLELFTVIYRETIGRFLSGIVGNIGYILIGLDKEKRGFHDYLSDTRVIYAKKLKTYEIKHTMTLPEVVLSEAKTVEPYAQSEAHLVPQGNGYSYVSDNKMDVETEKREDFIDENK